MHLTLAVFLTFPRWWIIWVYNLPYNLLPEMVLRFISGFYKWRKSNFFNDFAVC